MDTHTHSLVICYVCDETGHGDDLTDALKRRGDVGVLTVNDAEEALETLERQHVDCILSEYRLPEADGLWLLDGIRARENDVPFILYTGTGEDRLASRAISEGISDYVPMDNVSIEELAMRVINAAVGHVDDSDPDGANRDLRQSQKLLDALVVAFPDSVYVYNESGEYLDAILGWRRSHVNTREDLIGQSVDDVLEPKTAKKINDTISTTLETGTIQTLEYSIEWEHETHWFEGAMAPIAGGYRSQQAVVLSAHDITELKERERELARRERQLDLMRQVLSRVLRHNVRNDLTIVTGYSDVLSKELDGKQAEMADQVVTTASHLASVSDKARSAERLIDQDQTPTVFDLRTLLESAIRKTHRNFPHVSFILTGTDDCPVEVIPMIDEALDNLLENAAQHNDADEPVVKTTIEDGEDGPRITIVDNGPGIPDNELAVLERGEETALHHGSGIGLWLVNWIIDNSRATISFETDEEGTEVTLHIPDDETG